MSTSGFNVKTEHILTTENIYVSSDSQKRERLFAADNQFIVLCNGEVMVALP